MEPGCSPLWASRSANAHINESHSSLLTLELLRRPGMSAEKVQTRCIFTTHTPVAVAFETFPRDMVVRLLESEIPPELLDTYIAKDGLALATLAFRLSKYINGVTTAHMNFSRQLFPGFHIRAVTNGVHPHTWTAKPFRDLYDHYIAGWAQEPELLVRVDEIPHEDIRRAHQQAKQTLIGYVKEKNGVDLDPDALTIGFARRMATYKRATLLFSDLDKLREIGGQEPIQLIFSGKAHPANVTGKQEIRAIYSAMRELEGEITSVYLENYTMDIAGSDDCRGGCLAEHPPAALRGERYERYEGRPQRRDQLQYPRWVVDRRLDRRGNRVGHRPWARCAGERGRTAEASPSGSLQ
ncbi:MAG: glycogen/starch/alpha-glucan phosphorylase [Methanoculleus sp.]